MHHCCWNMKGWNDERAELKWSIFLELQSYLDNCIYHECILLYGQHISVFVKVGGEICHLGKNEISDFITLLQCLHLENKSVRGDNFSSEHNFLLESDNHATEIFNFSPFLKARVAISDWTSPLIPPRWGARECRSLDILLHPDISWAWVMTSIYDWCSMEDLHKCN